MEIPLSPSAIQTKTPLMIMAKGERVLKWQEPFEPSVRLEEVRVNRRRFRFEWLTCSL
jgi:hypothetical protein